MTYEVEDGQGAQALDINQLHDLARGAVVVSGCAPSTGSGDREVDVDAGTIYVSGSAVSVSSATATLDAGDAEPRKDVVYADANGAILVASGTADTPEPSSNTRFATYAPAPPDRTGISGVVIAEVWVPASHSSTFEPADIRDRRLLVSDLQTRLSSLATDELSNANYVEPQATAIEGTSYDADLEVANYHKVTMTGDVTFDFTSADASDVNSLVLHLVQDGTGGRTPAFTPTVVWDGGSAPSWSTGANTEDIVTFVHDQDGGQWIGLVGGLGLA